MLFTLQKSVYYSFHFRSIVNFWKIKFYSLWPLKIFIENFWGYLNKVVLELFFLFLITQNIYFSNKMSQGSTWPIRRCFLVEKVHEKVTSQLDDVTLDSDEESTDRHQPSNFMPSDVTSIWSSTCWR